MEPVISDKGHKRGTWDAQHKQLIIKEGKRTTIYTILDDGTVTATDIWSDKVHKKSA